MNTKISEIENGTQLFQSGKSFSFIGGDEIPSLTLAFETYGELSPQKDNAILIHHALSYGSHVASHEKNTMNGWWEHAIGPGKAIDTERFFVICINNLGSCYGSSGPTSLNPNTNEPYQSDFPNVTIEDMARSQHALLTELGLTKLHAVIGNSMAGMISLSWAVLYPDWVKHFISVSSSYKAYPVNIAQHEIQREIIRLDPEWSQGHYAKNPTMGLKSAYKVGYISYRTFSEINGRFNSPEEIRSYLDHNANKFADRFDANTYLTLTEAMDKFDITNGQNAESDVFKKIQANTLVISVDSDSLFLPMQQQALFNQLENADINAEYINHHSDYGHDAFYVDDDIARHIERFIT